jgi:phosphinothricin acetyltransferase
MLSPLAIEQVSFDNQLEQFLEIDNSAPMPFELRIATPADAAGVLAIYAPYCTTTPVSFEMVAPSERDMRARIERILPKYPWLVVESGGDIAGYVYASQHRERAGYRWAADVAVYIAAAHQRAGLGRALYTSLFAILRHQNYFKAIAGITLPNAGSVGLHEALGFRPVGVFPKIGYKLGSWLDVGWWQLDLAPEPPHPPEPLDFSIIRDSEAIKLAFADGNKLARQANRNRVNY